MSVKPPVGQSLSINTEGRQHTQTQRLLWGIIYSKENLSVSVTLKYPISKCQK
jgi:hypothetical protein